ncbi:MAG: hypothetical protein MJ131_02680 [Lachnospiraceae bacterium]|nr:hypothetical protein [Lachnospiraceae bacterium]
MESLKEALLIAAAAMVFCLATAAFLNINQKLEISSRMVNDTADPYHSLAMELAAGSVKAGKTDIAYDRGIYTREELIGALLADRLDCDIKIGDMLIKTEYYNLSQFEDLKLQLADKYFAEYSYDERGRVIFIEFSSVRAAD